MNGERVRNIPALIALLDARVGMRFGWRGRRDCASFAGTAIEAQTGVDVLGPLRWNSRRAARAVIDAEGGLDAAMDRRLQRIAPALAQRGDIAGVADGPFGIRLMVVEGSSLVAPGYFGLERMPRSAMIIAWDTMSAVAPHV